METGLTVALQNDVADNLAAGTEGFLRLAVEFRFHAAGVTEGDGKLVGRFPPRTLAGTHEGFHRAAAIHLDNHPTQFDGFQVEQQRLAGARTFHGETG